MKLEIRFALLAALMVAPNAVQALDAKEIPTRADAVDKSLEDLLDAGFEIVSGSVQSNLILKGTKSGKAVWIACHVALDSGFSGDEGPRSSCFWLND